MFTRKSLEGDTSSLSSMIHPRQQRTCLDVELEHAILINNNTQHPKRAELWIPVESGREAYPAVCKGWHVLSIRHNFREHLLEGVVYGSKDLRERPLLMPEI